MEDVCEVENCNQIGRNRGQYGWYCRNHGSKAKRVGCPIYVSWKSIYPHGALVRNEIRLTASYNYYDPIMWEFSNIPIKLLAGESIHLYTIL